MSSFTSTTQKVENVETKSFHIFKLPHLCLLTIFNIMELGSILKLAECSKKSMENTRKVMGGRKAKETRIDVESRDHRREITVRRAGKEELKWYVCARDMPQSDKYWMQKIEENVKSNPWQNIKIVSYAPQISFCAAISHLHCIFQCPIGNVSIKIDDNSNFMGNMVLRQSEKLDITIQTTEFQVRYVPLILSNFKTKELCFDTKYYLSVKKETTQPIVFEKVMLKSCEWLRLDNLRQMMRDCGVIKLVSSSFSSKDINVALKDWQNEKSKTLTYLELFKTMDPAEVLDGIKTFPAPQERPYASRSFQSMKSSLWVWDIKRTDGVLATVAFSKDRSCPFVALLVWYDTETKFPEDGKSEWQ